jgi:HPt (histidine-containing phosphotransfer) domain-containing protein
MDMSRVMSAGDNATFDRADFLRRNQDDLLLSRDVAAIFIEQSPGYVTSIREALAACDIAALRQFAHKLKGSSANLSLPMLSEIASMIETVAEAGDLENIGKLLPDLELRFEQAMEALGQMLVSPQGKENH